MLAVSANNLTTVPVTDLATHSTNCGMLLNKLYTCPTFEASGSYDRSKESMKKSPSPTSFIA